MARGRKKLYGERTVAVKIPESRVTAVRSFLSADVVGLIEGWKVKAEGKSHQPRWQHVATLLDDLSCLLHHDDPI